MMDTVALGQVERFRAGIESRGVEICSEDAVRIVLLSYLASGETIRGSLSSNTAELLEQANDRIDGVRAALELH